MKKAFNTYRSIPVADEGSAEKIIVPVTIGLVVGAVAVTGANIVKNNAIDTMNQNMGKAIHEQVTGEDSSTTFASALESGTVTLPTQFYDVDSKKQDK